MKYQLIFSILLNLCLILRISSFLIDENGIDLTDASMTFINKLFSLQGLPASIQLSKCLNQNNHSQIISQIIY